MVKSTIYNDKDYFDNQFTLIDQRLKSIEGKIFGNSHKGIIDRIDVLESGRTILYTLLAIEFVMLIVHIKTIDLTQLLWFIK